MFDRPSATTERRPSTSAMFVYSLLLHHISATSDTAVHIGRGAVLAVVITHGRRVKRYSGDIITQRGYRYRVMAIYTTAGPHAAGRSCSAFGQLSERWTLPKCSGGAKASRQPGHFQVTNVVRQVIRRQRSKGAR